MISRYFEYYLNQSVTEEAVNNYYVTHADDYQEKKVKVSHILFRLNRKMDESERQAKLTMAHEAYSKLRKGDAFEDIVKQYSEDTVSSKKGGDLGWLKEGSIDPRFSEKIFSIEKGAFSEPFETHFGYHIVNIQEGPMIVKQPFDAVKGKIRYQLRQQTKDAELKRLTADVNIKIKDK